MAAAGDGRIRGIAGFAGAHPAGGDGDLDLDDRKPDRLRIEGDVDFQLTLRGDKHLEGARGVPHEADEEVLRTGGTSESRYRPSPAVIVSRSRSVRTTTAPASGKPVSPSRTTPTTEGARFVRPTGSGLLREAEATSAVPRELLLTTPRTAYLVGRFTALNRALSRPAPSTEARSEIAISSVLGEMPSLLNCAEAGPSTRWKVAPRTVLLSAHNRPPCAVTMDRQMARPSQGRFPSR